MRRLALPLLALALAACSSAPKKPSPSSAVNSPRTQPATPSRTASQGCKGKYEPAQEDLSKRGDYKAGGLYAPHVPDTTPDYIPDIDCIEEPVVTNEPRSPIGNRSPYSVLGKQYQVMQRVDGYVEQGTASYYGNKFHGRRTSNQEVYDMYAFTAAHKTLPLPSFARVTNLDNGKSVVVRVNDRGPFHEGRVIDLSYAAAIKLGITQRGTGRVEVRALSGNEAGSVLATTSAPAPIKTTVATGVPTRVATGKPTPMDQLVDKLPLQASAAGNQANPVVTNTVAANAVASVPAATVVNDDPWRYHVKPETEQKASAEAFDAWMSARGVRVATGKPAAVQGGSPVAVDARETTTIARPLVSATQPSAAPAAASGQDVQLQVASFASRENADRALARLSAAGIARASLSDVASNGRTLWRLRVQAPDLASASQLAGRIAGLGFGQPQVVRE